MRHSFWLCLALVSVFSMLASGSADDVVVIVQGNTLDEDGSNVQIKQITIYATEDKTGSVIASPTSPDGKGRYTLQLINPPGPFTVFGTSEIKKVMKYARSGSQSPATDFTKNPVNLTFLTEKDYVAKHKEPVFTKHLTNTLKIIPKKHPRRKYLENRLDMMKKTK
jgi:hypothetical protein